MCQTVITPERIERIRHAGGCERFEVVAHPALFVVSARVDRHAAAKQVGNVISRGPATHALPIDYGNPVGIEHQIVDAVVEVYERPDAFCKFLTGGPIVGRQPFAKFTTLVGETIAEIRQEHVPQGRPHLCEALDAFVHHAGCPRDCCVFCLTPPTAMYACQRGQRRPRLIVGHAVDLRDHGHASEVLHHDHELGRTGNDVRVVRRGHECVRTVGTLCVEVDFCLVHPEGYALLAIRFSTRRQLHDDRRRP